MTDKPIIALLYDFDKTLCTTDMEDYAFIPALGYTPPSSGTRPTPSDVTTGWTASWLICTP